MWRKESNQRIIESLLAECHGTRSSTHRNWKADSEVRFLQLVSDTKSTYSWNCTPRRSEKAWSKLSVIYIQLDFYKAKQHYNEYHIFVSFCDDLACRLIGIGTEIGSTCNPWIILRACSIYILVAHSSVWCIEGGRMHSWNGKRQVLWWSSKKFNWFH